MLKFKFIHMYSPFKWSVIRLLDQLQCSLCDVMQVIILRLFCEDHNLWFFTIISKCQ